MQSTDPIVNIAAYKFITFNDTVEKRPEFIAICTQLSLKGTILLSPEGINLFLAGSRASIGDFLKWLRSDRRFTDLEVKESYSDEQPFKHMLVKLKREIITMKMPLIQPEKGRAPAVEAKTLKRWLESWWISCDARGEVRPVCQCARPWSSLCESSVWIATGK